MFTIWAFLLQTLTATGVALLLLTLKALFKNILTPKWHFAVWTVLAIILLIPTGSGVRYTLFHWQLIVEVIKSWCGDYSFTRVFFPIPILTAMPKTTAQWIFACYVLGVVAHLVKYLTSYLHLRLILRRGTPPRDEVIVRIRQIADGHKVKVGRVIEISGLPSAFVCGMIRPVLALPADTDIDDKVILHEIMHIKHRDTLWSMMICLLRCIHWCNPLLIYCANQAINDMERRCDQYVLELLEGEERRDYGKILLCMANEQFAKTPGSTSINNGGKNIRRRIEAIAHFKKYPNGMHLVSVCVIIVLAVSSVVGVQASTVPEEKGSVQISLAAARIIPCTTPAGAIDTYGKAILCSNGLYRAMCAPEAMQSELLTEIKPYWKNALESRVESRNGFYIYNLKQCETNAYQALIVMELVASLGEPKRAEGKHYLAAQNIRIEKENGRWVVITLDEFRCVETETDCTELKWGCFELPGTLYTGIYSDIRADVKVQTVYPFPIQTQTGNEYSLSFDAGIYYDLTPKPNAEFTKGDRNEVYALTHLGSETDRNKIGQLGISVAPLYHGDEHPTDLRAAVGSIERGTDQTCSAGEVRPSWGPTVIFSGSGGKVVEAGHDIPDPESYAADLYVNNELLCKLDLQLQEDVTTP